MLDNENSVTSCAMRYGLILSLYFIIKFIVVTLSLNFQILNLVILIMTIEVPFMSFNLAKKYKHLNLETGVTFLSMWMFVLLTFFYASLPEALITFVYLQYINPGFLFAQISVFSELYSHMAQSSNRTLFTDLLSSVESN